jgi:DNA replication protein DnaC
MKYLVDNSNIPKSKQYPISLQAGVDYDAFCTLAEFKDDIARYVDEGFNLYITSSCTGNGKTTWAIKLMMKYFDSIWAGNGFRVRGMFVHVPTLLNQLKNFQKPLSEEYKRNLLECDLVVWDDIASTDMSAYDHSQLLSYVDQRIFSEKANIFTGNMTDFDTLANAVGVRLASRIYRTGSVVEFKGKDRRGR